MPRCEICGERFTAEEIQAGKTRSGQAYHPGAHYKCVRDEARAPAGRLDCGHLTVNLDEACPTCRRARKTGRANVVVAAMPAMMSAGKGADKDYQRPASPEKAATVEVA